LFVLYSEGLINRQPNIARIIRDLDQAGGFIRGGTLGTNPIVLYHVLNQYLEGTGLIAQYQFLPRYLDNAIINAYVSILLYDGELKEGYVHYVMIQHAGWDRSGGLPRCLGFRIFNWGGEDGTYAEMASIDVWAEYYDNAPWKLITISR
jgi:hypothetical protein